MKLVLALVISLLLDSVVVAQDNLDFELRGIQKELEIMRQERQMEEMRRREKEKWDETGRILDSMRRQTDQAAERQAAEVAVKQNELRQILDSLEQAQTTRLLTEDEVRWLTATISRIRTRHSSIVNSEMSSQQKVVFVKKIWELPFFDRMTLIHAREKARWQAAQQQNR